MHAMQLLEAKKTEAVKRVAKLRVQLETAEADLRNLEITAETLSRLGLNPEIETTTPRGQSYSFVLGVLPDSPSDAKSPREIHDALIASGVTTISQDNVRTILSRHKDRFEILDGRYWRKVEEAVEPSTGEPEDGSQTQADEAPEW